MTNGRALRWAVPLFAVATILWLQPHTSDRSGSGHTSPRDSDTPDWQATHVTQWQVTPDRNLYLFAQKARHFRKGDMTRLEAPDGILSLRQATYTLRADTGTLTPARLHLEGGARLTRRTPNTRPPVILESPWLDYDRSARFLSTSAPVRIRQGANHHRGVGLAWWLTPQRMIIKKDVVSEISTPAP